MTQIVILAVLSAGGLGYYARAFQDRRRARSRPSVSIVVDPPLSVLDRGTSAAARAIADRILARDTPRPGPQAPLSRVELDVRAEVARQLVLWGEQKHHDGTGGKYYRRQAEAARRNCKLAAADPDTGPLWALILLEEVYEALAEKKPGKLRAELVQAGAVIANWITAIDRRTKGETA